MEGRKILLVTPNMNEMRIESGVTVGDTAMSSYNQQSCCPLDLTNKHRTGLQEV